MRRLRNLNGIIFCLITISFLSYESCSNSSAQDKETIEYSPSDYWTVCGDKYADNYFGVLSWGKDVFCSADFKKIIPHVEGSLHFNFASTIHDWYEQWNNLQKPTFRQHFFWESEQYFAHQYETEDIVHIGVFLVKNCPLMKPQEPERPEVQQ